MSGINKPFARPLNAYLAEDWIPALKYGAQIDGVLNVNNSAIISVELNGVPIADAKTVNFIGGTVTDAGEAVVNYTPPGGGGSAIAESFQILAADPGAPTDGDVWYNSTDNKFRFYENGLVVELGGTAGTATGFQLLAADPGAPADGDVWYNTTDGVFRFYQNGLTVELGTSQGLTQEDITPFAGTNITLATTVVGSVYLFKNGLLQTVAAGDYTILGQNITLTNPSIITDRFTALIGSVGGGSTEAQSFQILAADPVTPVDGDVWYNSTDNVFRFYQNGVVTELGSGTATTQEDIPQFAGTNITLATTVVGSVYLFKNGVLQTVASGDYTILGQNITLTVASLITDYYTALIGTIPSGSVDPGANNTFTGNNTFQGDITIDSTSTVNNDSTEIYGANYNMTATAGASFDFTGATVTGLSVSSSPFKILSISNSINQSNSVQVSDTFLYYAVSAALYKVDSGVTTLIHTATTTIQDVFCDSNGDAIIVVNETNDEMWKVTSLGVATLIYTSPGSTLDLLGLDASDNMYIKDTGTLGTQLRKVTPAGATSIITLPADTTELVGGVIAKSATETYYLSRLTSDASSLYLMTIDNAGTATTVFSSTTMSAPTANPTITSDGNIVFVSGETLYEMDYTGATINTINLFPTSYTPYKIGDDYYCSSSTAGIFKTNSISSETSQIAGFANIVGNLRITNSTITQPMFVYGSVNLIQVIT